MHIEFFNIYCGNYKIVDNIENLRHNKKNMCRFVISIVELGGVGQGPISIASKNKKLKILRKIGYVHSSKTSSWWWSSRISKGLEWFRIIRCTLWSAHL